MNSQKTAKILTFCLLSLAAVLPQAASAFDLIGVGGVGFTHPQQAPDVNYTGKGQFGLGAFFDAGFAPFLSLEIGGLYMPRKYAFDIPGGTTSESFSTFQIPVLLRVSPIDFISLGFGPYLALHTGDVTETTQAGSVTAVTTRSLSQTGIGSAELGLQGSLRLDWPVLVGLGAVLDLRYLHELTNSSNRSGTTLRFTEVQMLAGVRLSIL